MVEETSTPLAVSAKKVQIRQQAEADLEVFIRLVHPGAVLGQVHLDVIQWMTRSNKKSHQLLLLPRDHQKSRMAAYYAAWQITRNPAIRILYVSATSNLATKQAKFIKDILTSDIYRRYWPEMVNEDEGKREKWSETEFSVDHPKRKEEAVRDPTVFTAGLTTGITGLHCDLAILDDLVTPENAYTEVGRESVKNAYSLLASIEGADAEELAVGTRYYPTDLYHEILEARVEEHTEDGELVSSEPLYEVFSKQVEDAGDGTGNFLWPRQQRYDGKWFGFTAQILAKKKAQYRNKTHFRAQYYNDPNDAENAPITRDLFNYYDPGHLSRSDGKWFFKGRRLNVFAAIDFAYSVEKNRDHTAIVVVGVDADNIIYVLDILRFKTDLMSEYFAQILKSHNKWGFRKLRAESTAAQKVIVKDLKETYIRPNGLVLSVDEAKPNRHEGTKKERINASLTPKYQNHQIFHNKDHNLTQVLEEELTQENPPHDDIKDALASVMEIIIAPTVHHGGNTLARRNEMAQYYNPRFGGIS